jgi:hypothetical protein
LRDLQFRLAGPFPEVRKVGRQTQVLVPCLVELRSQLLGAGLFGLLTTVVWLRFQPGFVMHVMLLIVVADNPRVIAGDRGKEKGNLSVCHPISG